MKSHNKEQRPKLIGERYAPKHKSERAKAKRDATKEPTQVEYDEQEYAAEDADREMGIDRSWKDE